MLLTPLVFVLGLILSAARVRPWAAGRAVLTLLGSGLESILTGAASLLVALIRACQVLESAFVRNLAILSVFAFLGRATPFGGWSVLVLAALLPWSGGQGRMRRRWFDAEASPPPLDEAAVAASLASVGDAALRQRANPLRETLTDPALAQRQQQDRRRGLDHHSGQYLAIDRDLKLKIIYESRIYVQLSKIFGSYLAGFMIKAGDGKSRSATGRSTRVGRNAGRNRRPVPERRRLEGVPWRGVRRLQVVHGRVLARCPPGRQGFGCAAVAQIGDEMIRVIRRPALFYNPLGMRPSPRGVVHPLIFFEECIMELWKVEKFCETATLSQLRAIEHRLDSMVDSGLLCGTNARIALQKVREAITLRELFGER